MFQYYHHWSLKFESSSDNKEEPFSLPCHLPWSLHVLFAISGRPDENRLVSSSHTTTRAEASHNPQEEFLPTWKHLVTGYFHFPIDNFALVSFFS
jgi:hypothetical protein